MNSTRFELWPFLRANEEIMSIRRSALTGTGNTHKKRAQELQKRNAHGKHVRETHTLITHKKRAWKTRTKNAYEKTRMEITHEKHARESHFDAQSRAASSITAKEVGRLYHATPESVMGAMMNDAGCPTPFQNAGLDHLPAWDQVLPQTKLWVSKRHSIKRSSTLMDLVQSCSFKFLLFSYQQQLVVS